MRALEAFVRDFAGLEIRQGRNNVGIRHLSTRPALAIRHSASQNLITQTHSASQNLDDAFVPFDLQSGNSGDFGRIQGLSAQRPDLPFLTGSVPEAEQLEDVEELGDFEPELVIHQEGHDQLQTSVTPDLLLQGEKADFEALEARQNIDAVVLPELRVQRIRTDDVRPQRLDILGPAKTRAESRKERKIRRLEAKQQEAEEAKAQEKALLQARKEQRKAKSPILSQAKVTAATAAAKAPKTPKPSFTNPKDTKPLFPQEPRENKQKEQWQIQKAALEQKFGTQTWNPRKRISPDALAGIRALHAKSPLTFSTPILAAHFKVAPEAIRRILKSKWVPKEEEAEGRRQRWENRGVRKWGELAELGVKPPKRWREKGVGRGEDGGEPVWKGKAGEKWLEQPDVDGFVAVGDVVAEDRFEDGGDQEEEFFGFGYGGESIGDRIL